MVLESIIDPIRAKKHPIRLFFIGMLYAALGVLFSLWIFKPQSSLVMVFLTVIVSVPLLYATMQEEEELDWQLNSEIRILNEHSRAIIFLTFLFLGFLLSFSLWYIFLPADMVNIVFGTQLDTIESINARIAKDLAGHAVNIDVTFDAFLSILSNNIKVMIFCIFFSFFYGVGALFVLTWNASVISAAIGSFFRSNIAEYAGLMGLAKLSTYFGVLSLSIFRFMLHGTFEIVAYFIGGLAGGIISMGIINHGIASKRFKNVIFDALTLIIIAVAILMVAAGIEVFITPVFF